ncbi:MAG: oxygenase MpaB family protein [Acidimicrobiales bacterium]
MDDSDASDLRRLLISGLALAPAGANVIMQLSRLPIGHAIVESKVDSGSLRKHPVKRTRTTLAYIMVALFGTEHERSVMRREVNAQHHFVHSDSDSAIAYDAHDPELQLWVAACMFRGVIDTVAQLRGPVNDEKFASLLSHCGRFATTLQVSPARWPNDRAAFEAYWNAAMREVRVDDVTRSYLRALASLEFLPTPLARALGPSHRFLTMGFLPPTFREQLGLTWTSQQQRRFDTIISFAARANRRLPTPVREFPWNLIERDTRRRIAGGRSVL